MQTAIDKRRQRGFTLIEVLITLLIIAIGLLGLAGLQMTSLQSQLEAYQRAQAVMLAEEMANRIRSNAPAARAGAYTAGSSYGTAAQACDPNTQTTAAYDLCDWNNLLLGQEVTNAGANVGSVNQALGCIEDLDLAEVDGETRIRITVAWLGTAATAAPNSTCGQGLYGADDAVRRVAVVDTVLADLQNDPPPP